MASSAVRCSRSERLVQGQVDSSVDDLIHLVHVATMMPVEQRWQLHDLQTFLLWPVLDRGYQVRHSPLNLLKKEFICTIEWARSHVAELQMGIDEGLV